MDMKWSAFSANSANLDLARASAVLCVFFAHLRGVVQNSESFVGWHIAQIGVLIFFVHTSFVLMLSLERTIAPTNRLFGIFYLKRFFRLYPLSMFCVSLAFLFSVSPASGLPHRDWTLGEYSSNMLLTINLTYTDPMVGSLWTLPLEVQMYIALPILFLVTRPRPFWFVIAIWWATVPFAIAQPFISGRLTVIEYAPCFVAGVLAWRLSCTVHRRAPGWLWPFAFVATWLVFMPATHENHMYFRWGFCLAIGLVLPWFREITFQPLARMVHVIAKYSYGIYLSHAASMAYAFGLPTSRGVQWIVFWLLAVIVPVTFFHLIEQPMIQVGKRLSQVLFERETERNPPESLQAGGRPGTDLRPAIKQK